jgi:formate hydrogenlyase transcriptional activator
MSQHLVEAPPPGAPAPLQPRTGSPPAPPRAEFGERVRFEGLIADLSARFLNLPADGVDGEVEPGLRRLVEFLGLDRGTLFQLPEDGGTLVATHCWAAPRIDRLAGPVTRDDLPRALQQVLRGEAVVFSRVEDLPEEAGRDGATLRRAGPRSNVSFPLAAGGLGVFGALTFGQVAAEGAWPGELVQRLRLVAQVFANALLRKRTDQKLRQALAENRRLPDRPRPPHEHPHIVGRSPAIQRVLAQAEQVAATQATVLLQGETGTGKEVLGAAIHQLSGRRGRPMVRVNCAALPPTLVENELFGREKGAYTGALTKQVGRFELAHGSTLFLDEVGELPPEVQVKLLRVLQDGQLERLGSPNPIKVDVRVIAASNRDLAGAVRAGHFREDLFYRLNVFPITVPPLRERREDIPLLVWTFVEEFAQALGKSIQGVARESMEALQRYPWPGNVRELRNVIERAMILSTRPTLSVDIPEGPHAATARSLAMREVERRHILHVLQLTGWRVRGTNGAAALLGLKPSTLETRMAKLGLHRPPAPGMP